MDEINSNKNNFFSAFTINVVFVMLVIIGISLIREVPLKLQPSRSLPRINISYSYYGATAEVTEKQVTSRLEGVLSTVKGVQNIISYSSQGGGYISLELDKEAPIKIVRFEVLSLIREIYPKLPENVSYPSLSQSGSQDQDKMVQFLTYTINGNADSYDLYTYLKEHIEPKLSMVDGIQRIDVRGSTPYEYEILYNPVSLNQLEISKSDIRSALQEYFNGTDLGLAKLEDGKDADVVSMTIIPGNEFPKNGLGDVPIKKMDDRIIRLSDLAKIAYKQQIPDSYYRINGLNAVNMNLYGVSGSNQLKIAAAAKKQMQEIKANLPTGYSISTAYDATIYLKKELYKTIWRTIFSVLALLIFVLLISRNFRYLLVICISLFANLCIALIFYYLFKIEIHLYSLAGITVSLGIMIDNSIVMTDHLRHKNNRKVFLAVLAATLTTIGALTVIFFLEESQQVNLLDFALVIIINLSVSLFIALFFIPSILEKLPLRKKLKASFYRRKRRVVRVSRTYAKAIVFFKRIKWAWIVIAVLSFGLPLFMLPEEWEGEQWYHHWYNKSLGNEKYTQDIKPVIDKYLGGTLRMFSEGVREGYTQGEPQRTKLYVRISLPQGCTLQDLDEIYRDFENFISQFDEVEQYQTNINSFRSSSITIFFKEEFEKGSFPYILKSRLESKAIDISSADFNVYGVGRGFSNALHEGTGGSRLYFSGYNYNELMKYARQAKDSLLVNPRIKEVFIISGKGGWWFRVNEKRYFDIDKNALKRADIPFHEAMNSLRKQSIEKESLLYVPTNKGLTKVSLLSSQNRELDLWKLNQSFLNFEENRIKLKDISTIDKEKSGLDIYKENQEYIITVSYDFIGPSKLAKMVLERQEEEINQQLPLGYKAKIPSWGSWWDVKDTKQYYMIFVMMGIVYIICAILLESLTQPIAIVCVIPISFIGIFLTFVLFGFNFDQGGYASFLLVSGLAVNSALYILNDLNNIEKKGLKQPRIFMYMKAYNSKIIPIFLTILSTIIGLLPFIFFGENEYFWFALAVGTIGGLLFSVPAILIYLPLFMKNMKSYCTENTKKAQRNTKI